jgi:GNAT superfamily N-acetyltransferase
VVYRDPADIPRRHWTPDQQRINSIHHPPRTPEVIISAFPSHLHLNLMPALRGQDVGRGLMDHWVQAIRQRGSPGAHLAVGRANTRAVRFYTAYGFRALDEVPHESRAALWMGMKLEREPAV